VFYFSTGKYTVESVEDSHPRALHSEQENLLTGRDVFIFIFFLLCICKGLLYTLVMSNGDLVKRKLLDAP